MKGNLGTSRKLCGIGDAEPCRGGYGITGETSVSGLEKVDILRYRRPNPIARICRNDAGVSTFAW